LAVAAAAAGVAVVAESFQLSDHWSPPKSVVVAVQSAGRFAEAADVAGVAADVAAGVAKMGAAVVAFVWLKLGRFFAGIAVVLAGMPGICCRCCSSSNEVVSVGRKVFVVNWATLLPADCIADVAVGLLLLLLQRCC